MSYDVIVVGGSYAGLSAAMQLARARRRVLVIDSGLPRNRFARTAHGFLGQDGKSPRAIMDEAGVQLAAYPTVERVQGEATMASGTKGDFVVSLADGRDERAVQLVLATGLRDELPPIPGMRERWGVTVAHCPYCRGYELADRALGVLGNHPMAARQAALIPPTGARHLLHARAVRARRGAGGASRRLRRRDRAQSGDRTAGSARPRGGQAG